MRKRFLISAGGTPVWDEVLPRLLHDFAAKDRDLTYHVFVFVPPLVRAKLQNLGKKLAATGNTSVEQWPVAGCERVHILGEATRCTYQAIISGVNLVVSRAGGATVNDALACAVPRLLVPEPGHWQVDAIHRATVDEGYGVSLPYVEFVKDPGAAIHSQFLSLEPLWNQIRQRMITKIKRGREESIVRTTFKEAGL